MTRIVLILFLVWLNVGHAEIVQVKERGVADDLITCEWENQEGVPCVTITVPISNSNKISEKISTKTIITKQEIEDYNLKDLPSVINHVNNVIAVQSGGAGQQTSIFTRGSNSNHTLVLLNGIPINDQSTTNGAYDFGQDFMTNVLFVEVYKGSAGHRFGADAIGGAVNIVTDIDWENKVVAHNNGIAGNYATRIGDNWQIGITGGVHEEKETSALSGANEKDGVKNQSFTINAINWLNEHLRFKSTLFARNTLADIDGHSLALQEGYDSDNNLYAFQTSLEFNDLTTSNYITFHSHKHDRTYNSPNNEVDDYESDSYVLKAEHSKQKTEKFSYGLGIEYKYDDAFFSNQGSYNSSLSGDYDNIGYFANIGYSFNNSLSSTINYRTDNNSTVGSNDSYKIGLLKEDIIPNLNFKISHSTGFKNPSLYELHGADNYGYVGNKNLTSEKSKTNELGFEYSIGNNSMFSVNLFETSISNLIEYSYPTYENNTTSSLNQSGVELAYGFRNDKNSFRIFSSSLSSKKTDGTDQLRRPGLTWGANWGHILEDGLKVNTNYNFIGNHLDIHNSNWSIIDMPDVHLLDLSLTKNFYGIDIGFSINNLLDENFEAPHGFSKEGRNLSFVFKSAF